MKVTLSLYPNMLGLGYVCAEMPEKLLDFGILSVRTSKNERVMGHVKRFVNYYRPTFVIVRDNAPKTKKGKRIERLSQEIEDYAKSLNLPVHRYTREQVIQVFEVFGATTKYEVTKKIISWFPELESRMPKERKRYLPESYTMGIFDALALAITHQYLTE